MTALPIEPDAEVAAVRRALDALNAHVALLDGDGLIHWVNEAWLRFGRANGIDPGYRHEGASYPAVFESAAGVGDEAAAVERALRRVLAGESDREDVEYACHAPDDERWFRATCARIGHAGSAQVAVIHENVTDARRIARASDEVERLARQVQSSLLPRPTATAGFGVATLYRPGDDRLALGGDFFDVHEAADGRLVAMIGDVSGHGPDAAALGATLRAAWRTLAVCGVEPAEMMRRADDVLRSEERGHELFATVAGVWLDPTATVATCVLAGHPPPVVVGRHGIEVLDLPVNPPVGLLVPPVLTATFELPPGHAVLLYTDGVIEARTDADGGGRLGVPGLVELVARHGVDEPAALEAIVRAAIGMADEGLDDDVALIAVRRA